MTLYGLAVLMTVFGMVLLALDLLLLALTPRLLEALGRVSPDRRARAIMGVRFAPLGFTMVLILGVSVPAWLRHEPFNTGEAVSGPLLAVALLVLLPALQGARRGTRMFVKTRDRLRAWRYLSLRSSRTIAPFEVVEVRSDDLALCVGGYLKPTIYASTGVVRALKEAEFKAALAHEISHARARDPLRLLWMAACPDFLQIFGLDQAWRREFARACEFGADAGASGSDPERALDLASALLKVARLRTFRPLSPVAALDVAVSSAFSSQAELQERIEVLANPSRDVHAGSTVFAVRPWVLAAAVIAMVSAGAQVSNEAHHISEAVGRFLAP